MGNISLCEHFIEPCTDCAQSSLRRGLDEEARYLPVNDFSSNCSHRFKVKLEVSRGCLRSNKTTYSRTLFRQTEQTCSAFRVTNRTDVFDGIDVHHTKDD